MFSLLPGQVLGFTGSKLLSFGLAPITTSYIEPSPPVWPSGGGGGGGGGPWRNIRQPVTIHDNAYSQRNDDNEIIEILTIYFGAIHG